jgi:hypothetical protein
VRGAQGAPVETQSQRGSRAPHGALRLHRVRLSAKVISPPAASWCDRTDSASSRLRRP